jgi:hypothetical protein
MLLVAAVLARATKPIPDGKGNLYHGVSEREPMPGFGTGTVVISKKTQKPYTKVDGMSIGDVVSTIGACLVTGKGPTEEPYKAAIAGTIKKTPERSAAVKAVYAAAAEHLAKYGVKVLTVSGPTTVLFHDTVAEENLPQRRERYVITDASIVV